MKCCAKCGASNPVTEACRSEKGTHTRTRSSRGSCRSVLHVSDLGSQQNELVNLACKSVPNVYFVQSESQFEIQLEPQILDPQKSSREKSDICSLQ